MPDTPSSFEFESGRNVENVDMAQTGETNLPGLLHLFNEQMEFLLPAQSGRSYAPQEWTGETYPTVEKLVAWSNAGTVLRLIVTGTSANYPVLLGPVIYGEDDGTNDVKVKLTFYRYRYIGHETTVKTSTGNTGRTSGSSGTQTTTYTVKHGDTLWGICRKHYGKGSLYPKLARYNHIKNANIIYSGQKIKLPPASKLG